MRKILLALFGALFLCTNAYAAQLSPQGPFRALDSNGDPCSGCLLYTYEAGTTTNKATYTDTDEGTANANPVVLDSDGYADVWLGDGAYKLVLKTAADSTIWTIDDVAGSSANAFGDQVVYSSANLNITDSYENNIIVSTSDPTFTLLSAATAGEGWTVAFRNGDSGTTTITPNGAETINGNANLTLTGTSQWAQLFSDGTDWVALTTPSVLDEDDMASNSASLPPSQQSVIQYTSSNYPPTGSVIFFASSNAPDGWLLAYGQNISRTTYANLFNVIGETFSAGDGSTTFGLPDCRGNVIAGLDNMGGSSANRLTDQSGGLNGDIFYDSGGSETHTLTSGEMPSHTHSISGANSGTSGTARVRTTNAAEDNTITTASTGSGGAHNNVQPTIVLGCIIKL